MIPDQASGAKDLPRTLGAGDTLFALGSVSLGWFVLDLKTGWSFAGKEEALGAAVSNPAVD